jgi:Tfp pilus assembly protein PilV
MTMRRSNRTGLSLIEVMVAAAMLFMLGITASEWAAKSLTWNRAAGDQAMARLRLPARNAGTVLLSPAQLRVIRQRG